jgi:hypothetical protein
MISDGIENCLQYLDNFNPENQKSICLFYSNYLFAFIRRIQKEKKQVTIKHRMITEANYDDMALNLVMIERITNQFTEFLKKNIVVEETKKKPKKVKSKKIKKGALDYFINYENCY